MYETEISFKVTERETPLTDGKVCYQGQLLHNQVLNAAAFRRRLFGRVTLAFPVRFVISFFQTLKSA